MKNFTKYTFLKRFILVFIVLEICYSSNTKTANSQIYKAIEYAIAIDADTSDWQGILFETINKKTHLWVGQGMSVENWEGLNDLSFTWRAAWKSLLTWTGIQNDYWVKMDKYGKLILK